jgi:hypothetical protein
MAEPNGSESEEDRILAITKIELKLLNQKGCLISLPLKVVEFNTNDIARQLSELSKQLQELHIYMTLLPETCLEPHEMFLIQIIAFIGSTAFWAEKAELSLQLGKAFPTTM